MDADTNQDQPVKHQAQGPGRPPSQDAPANDADEDYFGQSHDRLAEGRNDGLKLVVVALVVIGATAIGLGLIFRSVDRTQNSGATSALAEHTQVMREAIEMAREAQAMNRQRMIQMQQAMEEAEGFAEGGGYPGGEDP